MTPSRLLLSRRRALGLLAAAGTVPGMAQARSAKEIQWEDLIPPGVPYAEIIAEGDRDEINDTWRPVYDANGTRLNDALDGAYIKMPGYIVPLEIAADGVRDFILVPYMGACIHTPPPPANQLVLVKSKPAWPVEQLWDAVWVTGTISTNLEETDLGQTGYAMSATDITLYEW